MSEKSWREHSDLGLFVGRIAYAVVNGISRFEEKYIRVEPLPGEPPFEPFSADVVRLMYRTLEALHVPDSYLY